MAETPMKNKVKSPVREARFVRRETPPKQDRTRTDDTEKPQVIFTDWASI